MRCLIVDDNPEDRSLVERMLKGLGYRATCVGAGMAALQELSTQPFDLAIVDMGMPGMSGPEVLRALRRKSATLRLLVVSGFEDRRHILEAIEAGADGYLVKDELPERLGYAVQEIRAGRSPLSSRAGSVLLRYFAAQRRHAEQAPAEDTSQPSVDASGEIEIAEVKLKRQ